MAAAWFRGGFSGGIMCLNEVGARHPRGLFAGCRAPAKGSCTGGSAHGNLVDTFAHFHEVDAGAGGYLESVGGGRCGVDGASCRIGHADGLRCGVFDYYGSGHGGNSGL